MTIAVALLLLIVSHLIPLPGFAATDPKHQHLSPSGQSVLLLVTKHSKYLVTCSQTRPSCPEALHLSSLMIENESVVNNCRVLTKLKT